MVEFPSVKSLVVISSPYVKRLFKVSGTYVVESKDRITYNGDVFYVCNPVIKIYKDGIEVKSFKLEGDWIGRIYYVNDETYLLLKKGNMV